MSPSVIGIIGIIILILIFMRMPIAFAMALVGFTGFAYLTTSATSLNMVAGEIYATFSSYNLSVIAMFVWMDFWPITLALVPDYMYLLISWWGTGPGDWR